MSLAGGKGVRSLLCLLLVGAVSVALLPSAAAATPQHKPAWKRKQLPANFFGVSPNGGIPSPAEFARMHRGGIQSYRVPLSWRTAEPSPFGFNWDRFDLQVGGAAAARLNVLPIILSTPPWLGVSPLALPVGSALQRGVWQVFLEHAVRRYGPHGRFWSTHPGLPYKPIRAWQIWNEENATWFTEPVSVSSYAQLLKISSRALKAVDPGATVVAGGLYGHPETTGGAISASDFLTRLYKVKGIKSGFDAIGLHPYGNDIENMRSQIVEIRSIMNKNGDPTAPIWVDEFGWGSGDRYGFDKGPEGQKEILVAAYRMLINHQRSWRIGRTYWFSWEDEPPPTCYYCSTSGLVTVNLTPKPAWYGYVEVAGGRP